MIAYLLPGVGIYGGVKVGVRFAETLRKVGLPVVVATPDGEAPNWFSVATPVVARETLLPSLTAADTVVFSLPHDHDPLGRTPARLVFHCQGTDPLIDPVIADPAVNVLTCWEQAARYVHDTTGRTSLDVGISIGAEFFRRRGPRTPRSIAYMSRRGAVARIGDAALPPGTVVRPIDGLSEREVADVMAATDVFVAIAEDEWFGLPALEAMAAGCAVVSVPTVGGDYLRHGDNCIVAEPERLGTVLVELLENDTVRERIRRSGVATAQAYREPVQADLLRRLISSRRLDLTA